MEGIAKAKARGVYKDRKLSVDVEKVQELKASGMGAIAIAREMGIGQASVYRVLGSWRFPTQHPLNFLPTRLRAGLFGGNINHISNINPNKIQYKIKNICAGKSQ